MPTGRIGLPSGAERGHRRFARGSVLVTTVFVDGNNVMGSRADGWWRNRAEATQRLVAEIAPVALSHAGAWTIVFDGPRPPDVALSQECLIVVHTGHGRRDGADDRIVELVGAIPDPATALVYTSDARLRARVHALGARVAATRPKRSRRWCGSDSRRWDLSGSGRPWTPGTRSPGRCSSGQALGERNGCPATGPSGVLRAIRTFTR